MLLKAEILINGDDFPVRLKKDRRFVFLFPLESLTDPLQRYLGKRFPPESRPLFNDFTCIKFAMKDKAARIVDYEMNIRFYSERANLIINGIAATIMMDYRQRPALESRNELKETIADEVDRMVKELDRLADLQEEALKTRPHRLVEARKVAQSTPWCEEGPAAVITIAEDGEVLSSKAPGGFKMPFPPELIAVGANIRAFPSPLNTIEGYRSFFERVEDVILTQRTMVYHYTQSYQEENLHYNIKIEFNEWPLLNDGRATVVATCWHKIEFWKIKNPRTKTPCS